MLDNLNETILYKLADDRFYARGETYFRDGLVRSIEQKGETVFAKVRGTRNYTVQLWEEGMGIGHSCTCPMGDEGYFCKHCVAAGLAWIDGGKAKKIRKPGKARKKSVSMDDVKKYLNGLQKVSLIEMVLERADYDDLLRERLFMKAAGQAAGSPDICTFRDILRDAIEPDGFVGYHRIWEYAVRIESTLEQIHELLDNGFTSEVIGLVEYAIPLVEEAVQSVDDSGGEMGTILERLQELHLNACHKAKPDPVKLAQRLFEMELNSEWDVFSGSIRIYKSLLGKMGLTRYRELAEAEWKKVPSIGPGQEKMRWEGKRSRITNIMETLAESKSSVDKMVEVKSRDLSSAYQYLRIAEIYKKVGDRDSALEWAEKGLETFPVKTDERLRDFLAAEYHRRKRHDEAMDLIWRQFAEWQSLSEYRKLKAHADRIKQWPIWRERALDYLKKQIISEKRSFRGKRYGWEVQSDHSILVEIFLWEKDPESAWKEAREEGCSDRLWLQLARSREDTHPEDAVQVYRSLVEPLVEQTNNTAYGEAFKLIGRIQQLMKKMKREKEFMEYIDDLKTKYKRKRNFMGMIDKIKLPATH